MKLKIERYTRAYSYQKHLSINTRQKSLKLHTKTKFTKFTLNNQTIKFKGWSLCLSFHFILTDSLQNFKNATYNI